MQVEMLSEWLLQCYYLPLEMLRKWIRKKVWVQETVTQDNYYGEWGVPWRKSMLWSFWLTGDTDVGSKVQSIFSECKGIGVSVFCNYTVN